MRQTSRKHGYMTTLFSAEGRSSILNKTLQLHVGKTSFVKFETEIGGTSFD